MIKWILLFLLVLVLYSCNIEKQIAREYIEQTKLPAVLILQPDFIYKTNREVMKIKEFDLLPQSVKDSLWLEKSHYLKYLPDSVFIGNFIKAFSDELSVFGFKTYGVDHLDTFLLIDSNAYFVNIAQIQLEEYSFPYTDSELFDDTAIYYKSFNLNGVDVSFWFEVNPLNDSLWTHKLLFAGQTYTDHLKGNFRKNQLSGDIRYKYAVNTIRVGDLINASSSLGRRYASYIFDFLMNAYISQKLETNRGYLHYDRQRNKIVNANQEKLIPLKN